MQGVHRPAGGVGVHGGGGRLPRVEVGEEGLDLGGVLGAGNGGAREEGEDRGQGGQVVGDGADEFELRGVGVAEVGRGGVDVEDVGVRGGVPEGGVVFRLVVAEGDDEVRVLEEAVAGLVPEEPDPAEEEVHELARDGAGGLEGLDDGDGVLPEEGVHGGDDRGVGGAGAEEEDGAFGGGNKDGSVGDAGVAWGGAVVGRCESGGGKGRDGRLDAGGHDVDGEDDGGGASGVGVGDAEGVDHDLGDLVRVHSGDDLFRDRSQEVGGLEALVGAVGGLASLDAPDDGDHGRALVRGCYQARDEVARSGPRGRDADTGAAGQTANGGGDEGGILLVAADDDLGLGMVEEGDEEGVDLGAGHAKDVLDAGGEEGVDDDLHCFGHHVVDTLGSG